MFPDKAIDQSLVFFYAERMIKAVIFDFDGTLVDSEPNYTLSDVETINHFGGSLTEEEHHQYIGIGSRRFISEMKERFQIDESFEQIQKYQKQAYLNLARKNTPVFPEMQRLLEQLHNLQVPMAVASGTQQSLLDELLEQTNLKDYFQVVLSSDKVKQGKPEPDVFLETARLLSEAPEHCLVLEDSQPGAEAARRAGMDLITIPGKELLNRLDEYPEHGLLLPEGMDQFQAEMVLDKL